MARMLVVDDDPSAADALAHLLREDGHTVSVRTSGADALAALWRGSYDAVITDLEMRGTEGTAVVRAAHERFPDAWVAAVTARGGEDDDQVRRAGASAILYKPVDYDELSRALDVGLGRRRMHRPSQALLS